MSASNLTMIMNSKYLDTKNLKGNEKGNITMILGIYG